MTTIFEHETCIHLAGQITDAPNLQYECSAFIIDAWIDSIAQGRSNVAPQKLPWDLIRTLVAETYGGKVDDSDDLVGILKHIHYVGVELCNVCFQEVFHLLWTEPEEYVLFAVLTISMFIQIPGVHDAWIWIRCRPVNHCGG